VQGLKNVSLKVCEELITQSRCRLFKTCWKNDMEIFWKFFEKCPNTSKKSHAHLQCVHNNCSRFEECQLKGVPENPQEWISFHVNTPIIMPPLHNAICHWFSETNSQILMDLPLIIMPITSHLSVITPVLPSVVLWSVTRRSRHSGSLKLKIMKTLWFLKLVNSSHCYTYNIRSKNCHGDCNKVSWTWQ
jgi:hypothetical protein